MSKTTIEIVIPNIGLTVTEVKIIKWTKKAGDLVLKGEVLAEFESDKAELVLESPSDGKLINVTAMEGDIVLIGGVVGYIEI